MGKGSGGYVTGRGQRSFYKHGITTKTTSVYIPDHLVQAADALAAERSRTAKGRVSRSEIVCEALAEYTAKHAQESQDPTAAAQ